jgi:hypothetical protein
MQPFVSEPRQPRLSPNRTPIVEQELISTLEPYLYQKYFHVETETPPSPTPRSSRSAGPLKLTGSLGNLRPQNSESPTRYFHFPSYEFCPCYISQRKGPTAQKQSNQSLRIPSLTSVKLPNIFWCRLNREYKSSYQPGPSPTIKRSISSNRPLKPVRRRSEPKWTIVATKNSDEVITEG